MDCKHARLLLTFVQPHHPAEVDANEAAELERHLADCRACANLADDEHRADECIGAAMHEVLLPDNLRLRILNRLAKDRDEWRRRWLLRAAGVAAAVLLGVWLAQTWFTPKPAKIDADSLAANLESPQILIMAAPPRVRVEHIKGCRLVTFQNQQVTCFVLGVAGANKPEKAHLLVLSKKQFDWEDARGLEGKFLTNNLRVIVRDIDHQFFYIMVYTGDNPNLFVEPPPTPNA